MKTGLQVNRNSGRLVSEEPAFSFRAARSSELDRGGRGRTVNGEMGRTLVEMMVASSLLSLVIIGILSCHIAGLRVTGFVMPKIQNAEYSRQLVSRMIEEIRCATTVSIGTGTVSSFTAAAANKPQVGNAIRIYATNASTFTYYYQDTNSWTVQRIDLNGNGPLVIADQVTNLTVFSMENFGGTVLTNPQNNCVLSMLIQMRRPTNVKGVSDTLQVRSKITRRNIF